MTVLNTFATAAQGLATGASALQQRKQMDDYRRALLDQKDEAAKAANETKRQASRDRVLGIISKAVENGSMQPGAGEAYLRSQLPELADVPSGFLSVTPLKESASQKMDELVKKLTSASEIAAGRNAANITINTGHDTARVDAANIGADSRVDAATIRATATGAGKPMNATQLRALAEKMWAKPKPVDKYHVNPITKKQVLGPDGIADGLEVPMNVAQDAWETGVRTIQGDLDTKQRAGQSLSGQSVAPSTADQLPTLLTPRNNVTLPTHKPAGPSVPTDYNDTSLEPDMEGHARDITRAFPGASISSRARSHKRNQDAGGVADSQHLYRRAFDVVGVPFKHEAAVREWAAKRGLEVIPEPHPEDPNRAHFHIQKPRQHASAGDPLDLLASVYDRFGISPGAANA